MHLRIPTLLTLAFLALAPHAPQAQEVTRADVMRMLGRIFTEEVAREDLSRLGFRGENLALATTQMQTMMTDRVVAGFIADRLLALGQGTALPRDMAAGGALWGVIDRGVGHLPLRDLRYYYKVEQTVLNAMPTRECGLAIKDRLPPDQLSDATARVAARLNTPALKQYYRIQLRAARLGATKPPLRMSKARMERAEAAVFNAFIRRLGNDPKGGEILRTFAQLDRASNARACAAGRLFIDTVMSLEGQAQHDALLLLSLP